MRAYSLSHLSDPELTKGLTSAVTQDRATTAKLLAHIAEFDARKLYLREAHPSMFAYCAHELRLSEDAAYKRIQAARAARQFPVIFEAVAKGRLHLSGVVLLAPHLNPENADELLAAATHKTKAEIEQLLAQRFPRTDSMALVQALPASPPQASEQLAPGQVENLVTQPLGAVQSELAPGQVDPPAKLAPGAPDRYLLQLTIGRSAQDKLRYAQELLSHQLPSGDLPQLFERALDALIRQLERQKFAATSRPRRNGRPTSNPRHIPAHVKRAVWERDGGQCSFVSEAGHRCVARKFLEFDHVEEVARGGQASVAGIRLRCRAHNQYTAECTFGAEFMRHKREKARYAAEVRRKESDARTQADARARAAAEELIAPLRSLGYNAAEARRAAALCEAIPEASLEQRVRRALTYFLPPRRTVAPAGTSLQSAP